MKNLPRLLLASFALLALPFLRAEDKPAAASPDVAGIWNMEVQTGQGTGTPVFTFTQEGDKLAGHYKGQLGEAPVTGSLKGDAITFAIKISPQGQELEITYNGTVTGGAMKGTVKFGSFGEGSFTGKKQAAK